MALNVPNPTITNPWHDGTQWWQHDGEGWRRLPGQPSSGIMTGFKNVLINGDFRVNQRGFDGDWDSLSGYGYDRWEKLNSTEKRQYIEPENLIQDETYTLSWEGGGDGWILNSESGLVTGPSPITAVMDSTVGTYPPSVIVPHAATNVQLERGSTATEFEKRSMQQELAMCQRYYIRTPVLDSARHYGIAGNNFMQGLVYSYPTTMRVVPGRTLSRETYENCVFDATLVNVTQIVIRVDVTDSAQYRVVARIELDAEL